MNPLLYRLGYRYYIADFSDANLCFSIGIDWNIKDHNSNYRKFIWEKLILKTVWKK